MSKLLISLFIVLHGLVHVWYIVLSQKLVEFRPEMGWTGRSWIFSNVLGDPVTRTLASVLYGAAAIAIVAGGIGIYFQNSWGQPVLVGSAILSALTIALFWDGSMERVVEKGLLGFLISLAIVGIMLGTARYRAEIQTAREHLANLGSQVVETDCGPIEYAQVGEGYPVLVVHGNAGGFDQGLGLAQGYLDQGFQVIAPSRFGYLRSPVPAEATPEMQADAFACLLDTLGIDKVAVFTSSAGVTSSVQLALRHPERVSSLILHSPNAPGEVEMAVPPKPVFSALVHSDYVYWALTTYIEASLRFFGGVPQGFPLTPDQSLEVKAAIRGVSPVRQRGDGMIFDTFVSNPAINSYPLDKIKTPTLVISAVDDPMALHVNARTMAEQIPNAQFLPVADGGHLLLGHVEEVKAEVTQFLRTTLAVVQHTP